ncbi:histidine kinase N-terminal 7TM domain-containing protein [Natrarchaeobius chitinivorans]|uniref:PAS domain S-box protein n=1 Tax=Natrarchaeobius chitinivorans TaxID=1679083 RepID=A0A3N6LWT7_NATCH|nr:histidine kinase N-terminal 7TM domain-containing protein [Natrarchaeobius chitinivorans]RQG95163.1 PAS domain S-box protein [Natrarchaeobius chitinivorans]
MTSAAQSMTFFMLICAVPIAGVAVYAFRKRAEPGARGFALCELGMAGWSIQLALITWPTQVMPVFVNTTIRHLFQLLVIFGWPLLVWEYTRRDRVSLKRSSILALLIIPAVTVVLTATNPWHHLVLTAETPANPAGISELVLGPWYIVHIGFAVAMVMVPAGLLAQDLRSAVGDHRNQLLLLLGGWAIGFPGALNTHLFRNVEAIPPYVDLTPLLFLVTTVLWGLALFRYQLFALAPVSRRKAVETMPDALLSVDTEGTIVDVNPAARTLFDVDGDPIGDDLESVCSEYPRVLEQYERGHTSGTEIAIGANERTRHFSMDVRPIEQGGADTGSLLVLRDITELKEREQELDLLKQVLSRVFRHNIRNELTILRGHAEMIQHQADDGDVDDHVGEIVANTDRILRHSEKAKELEAIIDVDRTLESVRIESLVRRHAQPYATGHRSVDIDTDVPSELTAVAHPSIGRALDELVQNAIVHHENGAESVRVVIRARSTNGSVELVVADNGPGTDPYEIETLHAGEETDLKHGSGIGLWMVDLIVRKSGGSLTIDDDPDLGGTRTRIELPTEGAVSRGTGPAPDS